MIKMNLIQSRDERWTHYPTQSQMDEMKWTALKQTGPIIIGWLAWACLAIYLMSK